MEKKTPTTQSSMGTNEQPVLTNNISLPESERFYSPFQPYAEISKEEWEKLRYPWTKEDEKVTFVTQNTEVRAGGRLFIWYHYFNESRDYVPGTLTQSVEELFTDEQCKELTANSYEAMERAVDEALEGYSE